MKTNLKEITKNYKDLLSTGVFEETESKVFLNTRKAKHGNATIIFDIKTKDGNELECNLYIVEKSSITAVLFVNKKTGDIVFNSIGKDGIEKSKKYIELYLERSVKRMLGIPLEEDSENAETETEEK